MTKILAKDERVKIAGQWHTVDVVLVELATGARKRVEYVNADGYSLGSEPYSRSKYKNSETDEQ